MAEVSAKLNNSTKVWAYAIPSMTFFVMFIILHIAEVAVDGCWAIGKVFSCFPLKKIQLDVEDKILICTFY